MTTNMVETRRRDGGTGRNAADRGAGTVQVGAAEGKDSGFRIQDSRDEGVRVLDDCVSAVLAPRFVSEDVAAWERFASDGKNVTFFTGANRVQSDADREFWLRQIFRMGYLAGKHANAGGAS